MGANGATVTWGGPSPGAVGLVYMGAWNASTNSPVLSNGVGSQGHYYVVGTAGSTNIEGITDWKASDWVVYNGTKWEKVDNSEVSTDIGGLVTYARNLRIEGDLTVTGKIVSGSP